MAGKDWHPADAVTRGFLLRSPWSGVSAAVPHRAAGRHHDIPGTDTTCNHAMTAAPSVQACRPKAWCLGEKAVVGSNVALAKSGSMCAASYVAASGVPSPIVRWGGSRASCHPPRSEMSSDRRFSNAAS